MAEFAYFTGPMDSAKSTYACHWTHPSAGTAKRAFPGPGRECDGAGMQAMTAERPVLIEPAELAAQLAPAYR